MNDYSQVINKPKITGKTHSQHQKEKEKKRNQKGKISPNAIIQPKAGYNDPRNLQNMQYAKLIAAEFDDLQRKYAIVRSADTSMPGNFMIDGPDVLGDEGGFFVFLDQTFPGTSGPWDSYASITGGEYDSKGWRYALTLDMSMYGYDGVRISAEYGDITYFTFKMDWRDYDIPKIFDRNGWPMLWENTLGPKVLYSSLKQVGTLNALTVSGVSNLSDVNCANLYPDYVESPYIYADTIEAQNFIGIPTPTVLPLTLDPTNGRVGLNKVNPTVSFDVVGGGHFTGSLGIGTDFSVVGNTTLTDVVCNNLWADYIEGVYVYGATVEAGEIVCQGNISGTLITQAQPNIKSVGTLNALNVEGILKVFSSGTTPHLVLEANPFTNLVTTGDLEASSFVCDGDIDQTTGSANLGALTVPSMTCTGTTTTSNLALTGIASSTKPNVLYYDTSTQQVSYGVSQATPASGLIATNITGTYNSPYTITSADAGKLLVLTTNTGTGGVIFGDTSSIPINTQIGLYTPNVANTQINTPNPPNLRLTPNCNATVKCVAFQPSDNKILIGGAFTAIGGVTRNRIARLNTDGSVDSTFNPNCNATINSIVIQPSDGKILIGGLFTAIGGVTYNRIARLNTDGSVDSTFINPNCNAAVYSIAVQPSDGKILIGGTFILVGGVTRNYIARLNTDGSVDSSFNPNCNESVRSIVVQPSDGKILIGGTFTTVGGVTRNYIARLNTDGSVDSSFNPNCNIYVISIVIQPSDNKILIGGSFTTVGGVTYNHIARLNTDGSVDSTFNPNCNATINSIAVQPSDGKILIGGTFTAVGGVTRNRIARLNTDGSVDSFFNPNCDNPVNSIAVNAPDGLIAVGGDFFTIGGFLSSSPHIFATVGPTYLSNVLAAPTNYTSMGQYNSIVMQKIEANKWIIVSKSS